METIALAVAMSVLYGFVREICRDLKRRADTRREAAALDVENKHLESVLKVLRAHYFESGASKTPVSDAMIVSREKLN